MKEKDIVYSSRMHRSTKCSCGCCMWHRSKVIKVLLSLIFLAMIIDLAAQLLLGPATYLTTALIGFVGLILLIVFIGWLLSMSCSCGGRHWIHGAYENPIEVAQIRYAKGEITKKQFNELVKELSK